MLHVTIVLRIFFLISYGDVWEDLSFSPKEHNVKKKFEAKTEVFFLSRETSFSMPAGEHNWFSGGIIHSFSLCASLSFIFFFRCLPSCLLKAKDISENWNSLAFLTEGVYLDLNWWLANIQIIPAHSYLSFPVPKTIETDALKSGWESLVNGLEYKGILDSELTKLNRNKWELFPVSRLSL